MGLKVKIVRELAGLTQEELAEKARLDLSTIQKIEQGIQFGRRSTHEKIAAAAGVPVDLLYSDALLKDPFEGLTTEQRRMVASYIRFLKAENQGLIPPEPDNTVMDTGEPDHLDQAAWERLQAQLKNQKIKVKQPGKPSKK